MITTIDGVYPLDNDIIYVIGYDQDNKEYRAWWIFAHEASEMEKEKLFFDKDLCEQQCDLMNQDNKI